MGVALGDIYPLPILKPHSLLHPERTYPTSSPMLGTTQTALPNPTRFYSARHPASRSLSWLQDASELWTRVPRRAMKMSLAGGTLFMCTFLMGQHKADHSSELSQGHPGPRGQAASVNCSRAAVKQAPASQCGQAGLVAAATSSPEPTGFLHLPFSEEAQLFRDVRGIGREKMGGATTGPGWIQKIAIY